MAVGKQKPEQQQLPEPHSELCVQMSVPPPDELAALATVELAELDELEAEEEELLAWELLAWELLAWELLAWELLDCAFDDELPVVELLAAPPTPVVPAAVPKSLVVPSAQFSDHRPQRPMRKTPTARLADILQEYLFFHIF